MKAFVGLKREGVKMKYGLTVYTDEGALLYSSYKYEDKSDLKFYNTLSTLSWVTNKLKVLTTNKTLNSQEPIRLFIGSKTVYKWFEQEIAPVPYIEQFSNLLLDMSFIENVIEVIHSTTADKKVLYQSTVEEKMEKVTDLFK